MPRSSKHHVHCGKCWASINVWSIQSVINDPHRKYKCKNCGAFAHAWTFRNSLLGLTRVLPPFLDPINAVEYGTDLSAIIDAPIGSGTGVGGFVNKYLAKLAGKVSEPVLQSLTDMARDRLAADMVTVLFEMNLILEEELKRKGLSPVTIP